MLTIKNENIIYDIFCEIDKTQYAKESPIVKEAINNVMKNGGLQVEMINTNIKKQKIINILGTEYTINIIKQEKDKRLSNKDGFCDFYAKEIVVSKQEDDTNDIDRCSNLIEYEKKCLRHEIIHAFFYESGLAHNSNTIDVWALDEEMVDWIAIQFPKLLKAFKEADCL